MAVAAVAVAATLVECHAAASLVAEWARLMAPAGAVIGTGAATGTAPVVIGGIRTAVGVGGMAIDGVTQGIMWSSLAVLAFPGGGVGAGVHGLAGDGATRMDITGTVTRTTALATMATAMDTGPSISMDSMEIAASPESPNYNAGCNALVITTDPLTESWGDKRGAQSGHTNRTTAT